MARKKRIEELDENLKGATVAEGDSLRWLKATDRKFTMRGLAWYGENGGSLSRLPLRAKDIVRPELWELAQWPASAHLAFRSDTTSLAVRALNADGHYIAVMATSSNGVSLYTGEGCKWRPWSVAAPDQGNPSYERPLFENAPAALREFKLYLPQYKEIKSLEIGFSPGARILAPGAPVMPKPVVFYGTSITHGGCTAVPGGDFVSSIGRKLNLDVINLGFAGNGKGDPYMAEFITEIDAGLIVLDYVANTTPDLLRRTLPRFVRILRDKHPNTPILLVSSLCFSQYAHLQDVRLELEAKRDIILEFYSAQRKRGERNIHFADGFGLLPYGVDGAYSDGVHPTNHGYAQIVERLAPVIEQVYARNAVVK